MITIRPARERGHFDHGWLDTWHTFSFGDYHDPEHMGFRQLRVINEDRVAAANGFPTHAHRDMEIITYVLEGTLQHRDSIGNGSIIQPGDVQRMSAGTGVSHSEYNGSQAEAVHLLQIWILPAQAGLPPSYEQRMFSSEEKLGKLRLVAAPGGRDDAVEIHQDVKLYAAILTPTTPVSYDLAPGRHAWVQVARGALRLNQTDLNAGDGAAISAESKLELSTDSSAEVLLFDLS